MKILQILVLIFGLTVFGNAQTINKAILSGSVYDAYGALIVGIKVTAVNQKGEKFQTLTNQEGTYTLDLTYAKYQPESAHLFKMAKYEITIDGTSVGFKKYTIKDFNFVPSTNGKMQLDFALDVNPSLKMIQIKRVKESKKQELIS